MIELLAVVAKRRARTSAHPGRRVTRTVRRQRGFAGSSAQRQYWIVQKWRAWGKSWPSWAIEHETCVVSARARRRPHSSRDQFSRCLPTRLKARLDALSQVQFSSGHGGEHADLVEVVLEDRAALLRGAPVPGPQEILQRYLTGAFRVAHGDLGLEPADLAIEGHEHGEVVLFREAGLFQASSRPPAYQVALPVELRGQLLVEFDRVSGRAGGQVGLMELLRKKGFECR